MVYAFFFALGMLVGVIAVIIRLGIQGNLAVHYVEGEDKPYMCLELSKDVETVETRKIVVFKVVKKYHQIPQK